MTSSVSNKKMISHSVSQQNFYQPNRGSFTNEDETIKRKSSLKDLLRQRKSTVKNEK